MRISVHDRRFRRLGKLGPVVAALALAAAVFLPLGRGNVYSMNGPFMYHVYPWAAFVGGVVHQPVSSPAFSDKDPRVRGINLHQHDYAQQFYPSIAVNTQALRHGQLPIWFPATLAGVPNLNVGITEYTHPVRLLLYLTLSPLFQTQAWIFLSVAFSFLGVFVLLRSIGLHPMAAALAGTVWSLNGVFVFWGLFENVPAVNAMVPWTLYALRLAIIRQQYPVAIVAGGLWGLLFHNGHLQFAQMWSWAYLFFCAGLLLWQWKSEPSLRNLRPVWIIASIAGTAAAVGAPVLVRTILWLPDLSRAIPSLELQLTGTLMPSAILRMLPGPGFPGWAYDIRTWPDYALQASLGVVSLVFAAVGLVWGARFRRGVTLAAALCLLVGLAVSLGSRPLIIVMRAALPFFGSLHIDNFLFFAHLGIVLLVALGAQAIAEKLSASGRVRAGGTWAVVLIGACLAVQAGQGIAAFYLTTPSQPASRQWNFPVTPIIQRAGELQGDHRVIQIQPEFQKDAWFKPMLTGRLSGLFGLNGALGMESLAPIWVFRLWHSVELGQAVPETASFTGGFVPFFFDDRVNLDLLRRLSVGLIMATPEARLRSADGVDLANTQQVREVYRGPDGALYVIPDALPRAYLVPGAEIATEGDALQRLMNGTADPTRTILLDPKKGNSTLADLGDVPPGQSMGTAQIVGDGLAELRIRVRAGRAGYLQVNDSWAPGWKATLDGKPVEVLRSDYAFRAVLVPEGDHLIEMVYRPGLEIAAIAVEVGALLIVMIAAVALAVVNWRARRRSRGEAFG
jgi:hypothetical protein